MLHHTTKQLFAWLGLSLALAVSLTTAQDVPSKPCNLAFKCSDKGPGVWATDCERCFVFPNACQLANENCQRQNQYEQELKQVPKKECQKLCANIMCPQVIMPVCAEYNGTYTTFSNGCMLGNHICTTGEIYTFIQDGPCASAGITNC